MWTEGDMTMDRPGQEYRFRIRIPSVGGELESRKPDGALTEVGSAVGELIGLGTVLVYRQSRGAER